MTYPETDYTYGAWFPSDGIDRCHWLHCYAPATGDALCERHLGKPGAHALLEVLTFVADANQEWRP